MHSHHSHSGEYILHGDGLLDDIVLAAQQKGFTHYCLTEHMPRLNEAYLYPEEREKNYTVQNLDKDFSEYLAHARKLQSSSLMKILVGFEVEGVDDPHIAAAREIKKVTDMCVGSTHHVHGIPIDYDAGAWQKCQEISGSTRQLFLDYFDLQYKVICELEPDVVGHFDLIRLFQEDEVAIESEWPDVWSALTRNIERVVSYGGLFELNSSAIRKGWNTPYPQADIARQILALGGRFCLSDDAHTVAQVGLNYGKVWKYIEELGLEKIYHLERAGDRTVAVEDSVADLSEHVFWNN